MFGTVFLTDALGKKSDFTLFEVIGKTQVIVAVGMRSLFPHLLSAGVPLNSWDPVPSLLSMSELVTVCQILLLLGSSLTSAATSPCWQPQKALRFQGLVIGPAHITQGNLTVSRSWISNLHYISKLNYATWPNILTGTGD